MQIRIQDLVHVEAPIVLPSTASKWRPRILPVAGRPAGKFPVSDHKFVLALILLALTGASHLPQHDILSLEVAVREYWRMTAQHNRK